MPAPESIREKLLRGRPVHFKGTEPDEQRTIPADWIADAARQGKRIDIKNAIITEPLDLKYATIEDEFSLVSCHLLHPADFSYSTFQRNLILSRTTFHHGVNFKSSTLCYDGDLGETRFISQLHPAVRDRLPAELAAQIPTPVSAPPPPEIIRALLRHLGPQPAPEIPERALEELFRRLLLVGDAIFMDFHVRGVFSAQRAHFAYGVEANFNRARFEKSAFFRAATFEGEANFGSARIGDQANFQGATFKQNAAFNGARIEADAFFPAATFEGLADFTGAHIGRQAAFQGATFKQKAGFNGARIQGSAFFPAATFEGLADFTSARIGRQANFQGATFKQNAGFNGAHIGGQAAFQGATFKQKAGFNTARIEGSALFRAEPDRGFPAATFEGEADFTSAHIGGQANFQGATFKQKAGFNGARIDGGAFFRAQPDLGLPAATFEGEANFIGVRFGLTADFQGTRFNSKDKPADFDSAKFDGSAFFRGATFAGEADFRSAHIAGQASFSGAVFKQKVSFNLAKIDGAAFFGADVDRKLPAASFEHETNFRDARIGSNAEFTGAEFKQSTSFEAAEIGGKAFFFGAKFLQGSKPSFSGTHFRQGAFFQGATFHDTVDFGTAEFHVEARFDGVTFRKKANFDASRFTGLAQFSAAEGFSGAKFKEEARFEHARFEHDARFDDVVFQGETNFREAAFLAVYFSNKGKAQGVQQFQASIDLRGCTYDRIQVHWPSLLRREECITPAWKAKRKWLVFWGKSPARQKPYDRQPYTQLEKTLRSVGQDDEAHKVYLERRRVERKRKWRQSTHKKQGPRARLRSAILWFFDWIYWQGANYGVRPYRLLLFGIIFLTLGILVFQSPGAVEPKETPLTFWEAARFSLRLILPVDLPLLSDQEPSDNYFLILRFSDWAAILKIVGWILVPLGIASLTGLLRRVAP